MGIVLTIVIISVGCYLAYCFYKQTEANDNRLTIIDTAEKDWKFAEQETIQAKEDLIKSIADLYGKQDAEDVANSRIWVGMGTQLLIASLGRPVDKKENVVRGKLVEKWYYYPTINRLGNTKYEYEITLEDHEITGWKNLT